MKKADAILAALEPLPEKVLVGVSGGVDSVALLHALVASGRKPVVLHFDHGWRADSAQDAALVRELARKLKLKCVPGRMRRTNAKREAEAREARYAFFARTARKLGVPDLVTAHHADDQVETFLLQLFRGGGGAGHGMRSLIVREDGLQVYRPWLGIWKSEIVAYARQHKLSWREDATNADTAHRRNLLRRRILPYLHKQLGPHVGKQLWQAAEIQRAESEWLDELCGNAGEAAELPVVRLQKLPLALQRRIIRGWLRQRGIQDIAFADIEAVRGLIGNREPAKVNLSRGRFARRRAGKLFVE
jgi:tRNA(Ile)-lysidine synthetase-like protein